MRILVALFAALIALGMAWRGYRRGALATLVGWLPLAGAVLVLVVAVRAAWSDLEHFADTCQNGAVAALAVYLGGSFLLRRWRPQSSSSSSSFSSSNLQASRVPHREEQESRTRTRTRTRTIGKDGLARLNRLAGAALGVVCAAVLCLGLACLGGAAAFSCSAAVEPEAARPVRSARWASTLRDACNGLADAANFGVVSRIPLLRTYGSEVRALVRLLNAPDEKLRRLAVRRGLPALAELPEVKEALADEPYLALIVRLGEGDVTVIPRLAHSPITRKVLTCPRIREAAKGLTPSALLSDLEGTTEEKKE